MNSVYFLGGSPGSGKTTVTNAIHQYRNVGVYHTDDLFLDSNVTKAQRQHMAELRELSDPLDIWKRSPKDCLDFWMSYYKEAFDLLIEKLYQTQERFSPLIAEGICILPSFLDKVGCRSNAYFLISSPAFLEVALLQKLEQLPIASDGSERRKLYSNLLYTFSNIAQIMKEDCERIHLPYMFLEKAEDYSKIYSKIINQFPALVHEEKA